MQERDRTMRVLLSLDDFNSKLIEDVSVEYILNEIQRVIEGARVGRAGANVGYEAIGEVGVNRVETLGVEIHHKLGCLLYYAQGTEKECISVGDETRLAEATENDDGNFQAAGHYLDHAAAMQAIKLFCRNGNPDASVQWINVGDLPEMNS